MRSYVRFILLFSIVFGLSGCFELIEDTTIHKDGSGEYKFTLNMSASQTRLNSVMALDSLNGKKVPSDEDLKKEITEFVERLNQNKGISNAQSSFSTESWILKFSCTFDSLPALKHAIYEATKKWSSKKDSKSYFDKILLEYADHTYTRKFSTHIEDSLERKVRNDEDYSRLNKGKCVFIQRFDVPVKKVSNDQVRIAKNKRATMLMATPDQILNDPTIISYSVSLNP